MAEKVGLDLIEVAEKAKPPVVKILDSGKYQYEQNKLKKKYAEKDKEKGTTKKTLTKHTQIKPATSGDMLAHRAKKVGEWLSKDNKVHIDLFLFGRYKAMDEKLHKERLLKFLELVEVEYKVTEEIKKSPKGYSVTLQNIK